MTQEDKQQSPWISVKDALPKLNVKVIIYHDYDYFVGYMFYAMLTNWWRVSQDENMDIMVSEDDLWMPIPEI